MLLLIPTQGSIMARFQSTLLSQGTRFPWPTPAREKWQSEASPCKIRQSIWFRGRCLHVRKIFGSNSNLYISLCIWASVHSPVGPMPDQILHEWILAPIFLFSTYFLFILMPVTGEFAQIPPNPKPNSPRNVVPDRYSPTDKF